MHGIIGTDPQLNKPDKIALVSAYPDTIECSAKRRFTREFARAVAANCKSMLIKNAVQNGVIFRRLIKINQPSRHCIKLLHRYKRDVDPSLNIYRVHAAFDYEPCERFTRDDVLRVVNNHRYLKRQRIEHDEFEYFDTRYSRKASGAKTRPSKIDVTYCDRHSKLTGECDTIHTEARLETSKAVKAAGLSNPLDIIRLDPEQFLAKQYAIKFQHDILEKLLQRIIRATCEYYARGNHRAHVDIERRVRGLANRLGLFRLCEFRKYFPRQCENLKMWACLQFDELQWACRDELGGTSPLSPPRIKQRIERVRLGVQRIRL